jgi:lysine-specific demethylase 8
VNDIPSRLRLSYDAWWALQHVFGPVLGEERLDARRKEANRRIADAMLAMPPIDPRPVDRLENPDPREFRRRYLRRGVPVVLAGLAKRWPCCGKWSPEWFAETYPDYPLRISTDKHRDRGGSVGNTTMAEYVASIAQGDLRYARVQKILHDKAEVRADIDFSDLMRFKRRRDFLVASQFFFGPKKSHTVLHCAFVNNLFVQAYGTKDWVIYPAHYAPLFMPPVDRMPTFRSAAEYAYPEEQAALFSRLKSWSVQLQPGDVLFNPAFHWHYVSNASTSISVSNRIWSLSSALRASPELSLATALATSPPAFAGVFQMRSKAENFQNFYEQGR